MAMFERSGPLGPGPEPDPLEAAFASLPDPVVPDTLMPTLISGIPGAGAAVYPVSSAASGSHLPASQGVATRQLAWWLIGTSTVAATLALAAILVPLISRFSRSLDAADRPGQAIASTANYDALTQDMTQLILKDTDPCRILPQQRN